MVIKLKCLDLNTKTDVICLCEVSDMPKSEIGREYDLNFSVLFAGLKNKQNMSNCSDRTVT
jgi:hypothetical protein